MTDGGPRVAVTSDRTDLMAMCVAAGLEPVHLPCIEVSPIRSGVTSARDAVRAAARIVVTSSRVVGLVWPDGMPYVPAWTVGSATSAAVRAAGGNVEHVGTAGVDELLEGLPTNGGRTVYPHAREADPGTIARAGNLGVTCIPVYSTTPRTPGDDAVDAVLFTSPSAVDGWAGARSFCGLTIGSIGHTTAARLRTFGAESDVVPSRPGYRELVRAVATNLNPESAS